MALRNRTALTNIVNQENTKNVKGITNGVVAQPTRRAALGEIGNKVNTARAVQPTNKTKVLKKPILKSSIATDVSKITDKLAVSTAKPVLQPPKLVLKKEPVLVKVDPPQVEIKKDEQAFSSDLLSIEVAKIEEKRKELPVITVESTQEETKKDEPAFSSDLLSIEDVDQIDRDNPVLVSIYSNDIYNYLRDLEKKYPVSKGFLKGQEVTPKMRCVLIDWLVEVHQQFRLLQETLYLTVALVDRFLEAHRTITRKRLQLVGVAAMFVACKYEEMYSPDISDFVYITDNAYSKTEILQMEMLIVKTLDYSLGRPLPLHFLRRYSKIGRALPIHHTMAKYFLEQGLVHYELCHYPPSLIAAAAIYLSFFVIGHQDNTEGQEIWTATLIHHSTYTKDDILPIVRDIAATVMSAEKSKYQAVRHKYTSSKLMQVSVRPELTSPSLINLAKVKSDT